MNDKVKLFLMAPKDLISCVPYIKDSKLSNCMHTFTSNMDNYSEYSNEDDYGDNGYYNDNYSQEYTQTTNNEKYQDYIINKRFENVLDDFISGLLDMNSDQKSDFLKTLESMMVPIKPKNIISDTDSIYNIFSKIVDVNSDNDIFNSIKVSYLEKTKTIALSSYNLKNIEDVKLKLIKEGVGDIRYKIINNPFNNKKIHTIMYDRNGEK